MAELTDFERAVLAKLLAGSHPVLDALRSQADVAAVKDRELSGVGFFTRFDVPEEAKRVPGGKSFHLGDVAAECEPLRHGAGFVLFVRDGTIDMLEGYTFDEPWPEGPWPDVERLTLTYTNGRENDFAELGGAPTATAVVHVRLLDEGVDVWRPVSAVMIGDAFRLNGPMPDEEQWEFPPGSLVGCRRAAFDGGAVTELAAFELVSPPRE